MEYHLYALLFVTGLIVYYLSTRIETYDLSKTYQVELTFLSLVMWAGLIYGSFNIEYFSADTTTTKSVLDYAYVGISLAFFFLSLLNVIVLMFYGSYEMIFKTQRSEMK